MSLYDSPRKRRPQPREIVCRECGYNDGYHHPDCSQSIEEFGDETDSPKDERK